MCDAITIPGQSFTSLLDYIHDYRYCLYITDVNRFISSQVKYKYSARTVALWIDVSWIDIFGLLGTPSAMRLKIHLPKRVLTMGPLKSRFFESALRIVLVAQSCQY